LEEPFVDTNGEVLHVFRFRCPGKWTPTSGVAACKPRIETCSYRKSVGSYYGTKHKAGYQSKNIFLMG